MMSALQDRSHPNAVKLIDIMAKIDPVISAAGSGSCAISGADVSKVITDYVAEHRERLRCADPRGLVTAAVTTYLTNRGWKKSGNDYRLTNP